MTAERERYLRLVAQGMSNVQACREVGVHPTTGVRWRDGRKMVDGGGRARYYPPIDAHPVAISPRYLSEDERVLIGDLLRAGHSVRSVATVLGRSPSTVSREIRRNVSDGERDKPWEAPCPGPSARSARRGMGAMPDTMQPAPLPSVYRLRVVVRGVSPLIWRRLLVPADTTIAGLHAVLQVAFGWTGTHLHRFVVQGREYGIGYVGGPSFGDDPRRVRPGDLGPAANREIHLPLRLHRRVVP